MNVFDPHTMPEERRNELRDCIHGRHARKCPECDLVFAESELLECLVVLGEIAGRGLLELDTAPLAAEALAVHRALLAEVAELRASVREKTATIDRMLREVAES